MAAQRQYNRYQYETSPRKLQPEYQPKKEPYKSKKTSSNKKVNKPLNKKQKDKIKKQKFKTVMLVMLVFVVLCAISFRNTQINEKFVKVQGLQQKLSEVQKENEQLEVSIENSLNLSNIEKEAKERLGMQKLDNTQKVYINLPKRDYVESANEKIKVEKEKTFIEKIINNVKNIIP